MAKVCERKKFKWHVQYKKKHLQSENKRKHNPVYKTNELWNSGFHSNRSSRDPRVTDPDLDLSPSDKLSSSPLIRQVNRPEGLQ